MMDCELTPTVKDGGMGGVVTAGGSDIELDPVPQAYKKVRTARTIVQKSGLRMIASVEEPII